MTCTAGTNTPATAVTRPESGTGVSASPDEVLAASDRHVIEVGHIDVEVDVTASPLFVAYAFLGAPGDDVWLLRQNQDFDLLWPGWNPTYPSDSTAVTWRLDDVYGGRGRHIGDRGRLRQGR